MSTKPRTRENFPRMKVRGGRRRAGERMARRPMKALGRASNVLESFQAIVAAARQAYLELFKMFFPVRQADVVLAPPVFEMPEYPVVPAVRFEPLPLVVDRAGIVKVSGS